MIKCKLNDYRFDPERSALENLFAMIYRNNPHYFLKPEFLEAATPTAIETDEDDCNTIVVMSGKANSPIKGEVEIYYARADINTYYPTFQVPVDDIDQNAVKSALIDLIDGRFNLVDGEFDIDIPDEITYQELLNTQGFNLVAKDESYIYIGEKTIHLFWAHAPKRISDDGIIRITDEGYIRISN